MQDVTGFMPPHAPQFEKNQVVELVKAQLCPPDLAHPGWTILTQGDRGQVIDCYYVHPEESEFVGLAAGWYYALHSTETATIVRVAEDHLIAADDTEFNLGDMVIVKRELHYTPFFNNGDNETIPTGTRAIVTEEKNPDGDIRIAPIEVHTHRQYLVKPSDIEIDEDVLW